MKKSTVFFNAVMFLFAATFSPNFASLYAQTNFVKYTGNPVLPLGNPGEWDGGDAAFAHVRFDGSIYQMWYSGTDNAGSIQRIFGYATSLDGLSWTRDTLNNPVFGLGNPGEFDDYGIYSPFVLFDGSLYEMWYSANAGNFTFTIGYATATEPTGTWTRHPGPVLTKGAPGTWDGIYLGDPVVIHRDTLYQMWYTGYSRIDQTGYATSTDGINWSKHPEPALRVGSPGEWDDKYASALSVIFEDNEYKMWYGGDTGGGGYIDVKIGYATSPDGITWTKYANNPILKPGPPGSWDGQNAWWPRVIKDKNRYRMWYSGRNTGNEDRIGYAEDFSNAAHTDSIRVNLKTVLAGAEMVSINAYTANPHNENLTARARILSADGVVNESVDLTDSGGDGRWFGRWAVPVGAHDYSVGVELNNISAGYIHNSLDWGVFDEFQSISPSHSFTQIDSIDDGEDGEANDLIVASNGTLFLANGPDGLRAYIFDGASFTNVAHINDGGTALDAAVASDGTIFLANGDDGLRAYSYDGSSFTNRAHINDGGHAFDVALGVDGTIFLANGSDGLRAYTYDGASLTNIGHIFDCSTSNCCCGATGIVISADGTIFLANNRDGLRAYRFDGNTFTNTAHINDVTYISGAYGVAIGTDGTVFLANGADGLFAYNYDGSSFTRKANISTGIGEAHDVALTSDGTIFLAIKPDWLAGLGSSLWAYDYDSSSLTPTGSIETSRALGVATGTDGTVFLANGADGLFAYSYLPHPTSVIDDEKVAPAHYQLLQNYPNPFNPTTTINYELPAAGYAELKIYNTLGQEIRTLVNSTQPVGTHQAIWDGRDSRGNIVPAGVYFYRLRAGAAVETRKMLLIK